MTSRSNDNKLRKQLAKLEKLDEKDLNDLKADLFKKSLPPAEPSASKPAEPAEPEEPAHPPPKRPKRPVEKQDKHKIKEKEGEKKMQPMKINKTPQNVRNVKKNSKLHDKEIEMLTEQLKHDLSLRSDLDHTDRAFAETMVKFAGTRGTSSLADHGLNNYFAKKTELMNNRVCWERNIPEDVLLSLVSDDMVTAPTPEAKQQRIQMLRDQEIERKKKIEQRKQKQHNEPIVIASQSCLSLPLPSLSSSSLSSSSSSSATATSSRQHELKTWATQDVHKWLSIECKDDYETFKWAERNVRGRDLYIAMTEPNPQRTLASLFRIDTTDGMGKIHADRIYSALCARFGFVQV